MFKFGNPIVLDGSGRIKTDSVNEKRIELVLSRFDEWAKTNGKSDKFSYAISKQQSNRSLIAFPAAGFAFGVLASFMFVHPNSRYIGKIFTLFTTYLGYKAHQSYEESYNHSRRFGNFWNYPIEIRRMIDNNDSRYAFKWLKEDYLNISSE